MRSGADQGAIPPQALERLARGERMALATVVKKAGSAPRGVGAKLLLDSGGSVFGTVGGGAGEAAVVSAAQEVLDLGFPRLVECAMTNQNAGEEGMVCGGTLTVLIEPVN